MTKKDRLEQILDETEKDLLKIRSKCYNTIQNLKKLRKLLKKRGLI